MKNIAEKRGIIMATEEIGKEFPSAVKSSEFGCRNCLWEYIECIDGSKYDPKAATNNACARYNYYD